MNRRTFLRNSTALLSAFPLLKTQTLNMFNTRYAADDEVVKMNIGTIRCTLFRDLQFKYLANDFFMNVDEVALKPALEKYRISDGTIPSPFVALLLEQNDKRILIDTGIGFTEKPVMVRGKSYVFNGSLLRLLQQQGIKTTDITDVVISHFHPDHIGGIFSEAAQLHFPNAQFHMHEDEWNYWHSSKAANQPDQFKYFIERNITKLKNENLRLIKGDFINVLPGLMAVKAEGHTPGQIALIIHSEKENLLYISDAFLHPLHIENLDWQTNYDWDHEKAKNSRVKLLDLAYKENMLVSAFHFDFPGLGTIDKYNNLWKWQYQPE